ncbi:MAG: hypothetical protein WAN75_47990 [Xanthobacteraceae bacterium]|jgi:hypothetical protein
MSINHPLPEHVSFEPEEVKVLLTAFDAALRELGLARSDPAALLVAKRIMALARRGERDPTRLREDAVKGLRQLLGVANAP